MKNLNVKSLFLAAALLVGFAPLAIANDTPAGDSGSKGDDVKKAVVVNEAAKKEDKSVKTKEEYQAWKKEKQAKVDSKSKNTAALKALEAIKADEDALKNETDETKKKALQNKIKKAKEAFNKDHAGQTSDSFKGLIEKDDEALKQLEEKAPGVIMGAVFFIGSLYGISHFIGAIENNPKTAAAAALVAGLGVGYIIASADAEEEVDWA